LEPLKNKVCVYNGRNTRMMRDAVLGKGGKQYFHTAITLALILGVWQLAANNYNSNLLLPGPVKTVTTLISLGKDKEIVKNLLITMGRVLTGFSYAIVIGVPLGFLMGYSRNAMQILAPVIDSVRQIPIMAWVPLTIVWFGLGDGPTIFLIAFSGIFPVVLNTIAGVQSISKDYYNAARSMGAGPWSIFAHVILPGSLPDILTGARIALSTGWMSVI